MDGQPSQIDSDWEFHLDPFGQAPGLWNLYTQLTLFYDHPHAHAQNTSSQVARDSITQTLRTGLERLSTSFPWVAGQVIRTPRGNLPDYYVIKTLAAAPDLVVKYLDDELPLFEVYEQSGFPISLLDEDLIAPRKTKGVSGGPKAVFLVQVSFVRGGVLVTFAGQHGTLDLVGLGEVLRLLSKACRGEDFTSEELEVGNCDRRRVVPLLDGLDDGAEQSEEDNERDSRRDKQSAVDVVKTVPVLPQPSSTRQNVWAYFTCSSASLQALKKVAIESITLTSGFVSTDDVLSAFIWQCVSRARRPRVAAEDMTSFARTIDLRRFLDVSPIYPGNLASKTHTTYTFSQLLESPLGEVASQLRRAIDPKTSKLAHEARATITLLSNLHPRDTNRKASKSSRSRDLSRDVAFSSWSKVDYFWHLDFDMGLGEPISVRRPSFAPSGEQPMEGVIYLMPKKPDGEIAVAICLENEDMERLTADKQWCKYARYVG